MMRIPTRLAGTFGQSASDAAAGQPRNPSPRWIGAAALYAAACLSAGAQTADGDWPLYNRDLAGTRHSPLTQISTTNVDRLELAWSYPLGRHGTSQSLTGGSELTPIVVGGVMYVTTADRVVALDADTGEELWDYQPRNAPPSRRGLAYWPGDASHAARVVLTAGRNLIGLDAGDGTPASGFGDGGVAVMPVVYNGAPLVFDRLIIVGSNSAPGSVRAFDVVSAREVWSYRSTPQAGEPGAETWEDGSYADQPNLLHWAFSMTLDAERGLLFTSFESPGPYDYYGGDRPGDNLFGNSVVALDVQTGERRWFFQTVHHDIWDYDLPSPPGLLDVTIDGRPVPVLAQATKTGYMYILNRVTGEPVFGVVETPVPASDVPGERTSPTQPIPVKPPPIAKVSFSAEDIVTAADTTASHARFCREFAERSGGFHNAGPFTPYLFRAPGAAPRSTLLFPGSIGGSNWGGTASDPALGYVYVNTMDEASPGWIEPREPGADLPYRRNSIGGPTSRFWWAVGDPDVGNIVGGGERAWPCNKPPWGHLVAVDAATGEIAWKVPLGITDQLPADRQLTGRLNMGGPMTTAGGLVFIGASNDRRFRAFDARSGAELWVTRLEMSAHAVPITYTGQSGRQYVAIAAAGDSAIDDPSPPGAEAIVAFRLPDSR